METKKRYGCLSPDKKRDVTVSARLNQEEVELLDSYCKSTKMKRGEYLREAGLRNPPASVPEVNREKWLELGRLGSNLNQISRRLNQGDPLADQIDQVRDLVAQIRVQLLGGK